MCNYYGMRMDVRLLIAAPKMIYFVADGMFNPLS